MGNLIIVAILLVVVIIAVRSAMKHFKGEGSCCGGGGDDTPVVTKMERKKLSGTILGKKTVQISGMHCEHCVQSVTKAINAIDGASADVNLRTGKATVAYDRAIADDDLIQVIEQAGFQVLSIET